MQPFCLCVTLKHSLVQATLAGFVYQSSQIDMNWVFWDFWPYESNPQYKSFENRCRNRNHNTNLLKTGLQIESTIPIFLNATGIHKSKTRNLYGFGLVQSTSMICKDFWGFEKTGLIFWKLAGFVMYNTNQIFPIWYESRICIVRYKFNLFEVRIRSHNMVQINGFAKRVRVFKNLLYQRFSIYFSIRRYANTKRLRTPVLYNSRNLSRSSFKKCPLLYQNLSCIFDHIIFIRKFIILQTFIAINVQIAKIIWIKYFSPSACVLIWSTH